MSLFLLFLLWGEKVLSPRSALCHLLLAAVPWLWSGGFLTAAELHTLEVVSYPARPAKLALWLAQDSGIFERHGLKVTIKEPASSEQLLEAVRGGAGQIYAATANWIVSAIGDGADLTFFANTGYSVLKLVAHPSIRSPQELREKRSAPEKLIAVRTALPGKLYSGSVSIRIAM